MGIVTIVKYLPHVKDGLYVNNPHFFVFKVSVLSCFFFFFQFARSLHGMNLCAFASLCMTAG